MQPEPDKGFVFTPAAWAVVAIGAVAFIAGWQLGWFEFFAIAAGCGVLILFALPFILGRTELQLRRSLQPQRVVVGEPVVAEMVTTNRGRSRSRAQVVTEMVADRSFVLDVPAIAAGRSASFDYPLPSDKRGAIKIGPAIIAKSDPLGLFLRSVGECPPDTLFVHPRTVALSAIPAGMAKDLEGPTHDNSPAGDVAFHTIREYQIGDDHRHVHWMSTARTGQLMVRHYVDNRRPHMSVIVDALASTMTEDEFETAVEIAASLGASAVHEGRAAAVQIGDEVLVSARRPATLDDFLDRAASVQQQETFSLRQGAIELVRGEVGTSIVTLIVGTVDLDVLSDLCAELRRSAKVIVVPVADDDQDLAVPRARTVPGGSLDSFVAHWEAFAS